MKSLKNSVHLLGHLGQDPEIIVFDSGNRKANFSLATTDTYKNAKGDKVEDTQWHNVVAWGAIVSVIESYLTKGMQIALEGKLVHRQYDDKDGNKKYITEINANDILLLGKKS